jgi:hypothetical protein
MQHVVAAAGSAMQHIVLETADSMDGAETEREMSRTAALRPVRFA